MSRRSPAGAIAAGALAMTLLAAPAQAAPPLNDAFTGASVFASFTAENGVPTDLTGVAELVEATPDSGVPRCLGRDSFARTVWFRLPESAVATEVGFEATGRRLDVLDLAAYVQEETPLAPAVAPGAPPAPAPAPPPPVAAEPQACAGAGDGGAGDAGEPTAGVSLLVPARHPVLLQVGRRGAVR